MKEIVYYSQKNPKWKNTMYSSRGDTTQTIGASACGPTSAAMVISTLTNNVLLPTMAAKYAIENGFRTSNEGTSWGFFSSIAEKHGLTCSQTSGLNEVKTALSKGKLVIASMKKGHFTGGGHYILLVGINGAWIDVYDPNHSNRRYGSDGLVDQGVKDDGKVKSKESVFSAECKQYWIFDTVKKDDTKTTQSTIKDDEEVQTVKMILTKDNSVVEGFMKDNANYIPVSVLKELGHRVTWDNENKKLYIS
ncbi:C39 family peptidase [Paenibacillus donghaensis]|uniref:Peptidase C39-like domain-containing protein n=1 Tax=Paenibacillus donghaensis TaxID=414771 RepID=A0A2Z2KHX3_9BACL|nr:C39 family peptidase [Paenibacillus donghaensis]ASA22790.1 hypothetical protein B9T62_19480 [Paenibacillus donghaensis]